MEFLLKGNDFKRNGIEKLDVSLLPQHKKWILFDDDYLDQIKIRKEYYKKYPEIICQYNEELTPEINELYFYILKYLKIHYPREFSISDDSFANNLTDSQFEITKKPKDQLRQICLNFSEDFLILKKEDDYRLKGGVLCFPSGWSLKDKKNMTVREIHSPVPYLNDNLGQNINSFMINLSPGQIFWRINFLTSFSNKLTCLKEIYGEDEFRGQIKINESNINDLFLRNERECFVKLPHTQSFIFSIKTYLTQFLYLNDDIKKMLFGYLSALPNDFEKKYRNFSDTELGIILKYLK